MMALRAIIQKPYEEFIQAKRELKKTKGKIEIAKGKPFVGKDYKAFCNLSELFDVTMIYTVCYTCIPNAQLHTRMRGLPRTYFTELI